METKIYYRVVTPSSFSNLYADNLELAKAKLEEFGSCVRGDKQQKEYWKKQAAQCKIVKVIEITEEV